MSKSIDLSVYFILDPSLCAGRDIVDVARLAVSGGVTIMQLRNKSGAAEIVAEQGRALMEVLAEAGVPLLINDHVDVAAEIGAAGVHMGQGDIQRGYSAEKAREKLGADAIIGLTAFKPEHFEAIDPGVVDYTGCGPVYTTFTEKGKPVIGVDGLTEFIAMSSVPVVGIGGVTPENAAPVFGAGVAGVAMMRSISQAYHPDIVARSFGEVARKHKIKPGA